MKILNRAVDWLIYPFRWVKLTHQIVQAGAFARQHELWRESASSERETVHHRLEEERYKQKINILQIMRRDLRNRKKGQPLLDLKGGG